MGATETKFEPHLERRKEGQWRGSGGATKDARFPKEPLFHFNQGTRVMSIMFCVCLRVLVVVCDTQIPRFLHIIDLYQGATVAAGCGSLLL